MGLWSPNPILRNTNLLAYWLVKAQFYAMASLGFNNVAIRNLVSNPYKLNPSFSFLTTMPFHFFHTSKKPLKNQFRIFSSPSRSVSESSVSSPLEAEAAEEDDDPTAELCYLDPETDPQSISEWELDFCSRPILDIRGKKIWELVVCDSSLSLQYTKYFPNNVINSITLKDTIISICDELGLPLPDKVRFFRLVVAIFTAYFVLSLR